MVINADSAQVYADLQVLSARPTADEMGGVEHRLFGEWDGAEPCSAADWARRAREEIASVHASGDVPILCGGTGLYLRTLLDGIAPIPTIPPDVRDTVRALAQPEARAALEREDPEAAGRLAPADVARTQRALEVLRGTGRPIKAWQSEKVGGIGASIALHPLILLPAREWLMERCDTRFAMMLEGGAEEEVRALLARDLDPALPVMRAIGVPEIAACIQGELSRAQALEAGQLATRQYAKRQYTWFRNQPPPDWPRVENKTIAVREFFVSLFQSCG